MSTTNEEKKPKRKLKLVDGPTGKESSKSLLKRQKQAETLILNWQKAIKELEYTGTLIASAINVKRHKLANIEAWEATEALNHFNPI